MHTSDIISSPCAYTERGKRKWAKKVKYLNYKVEAIARWLRLLKCSFWLYRRHGNSELGKKRIEPTQSLKSLVLFLFFFNAPTSLSRHARSYKNNWGNVIISIMEVAMVSLCVSIVKMVFVRNYFTNTVLFDELFVK